MKEILLSPDWLPGITPYEQSSLRSRRSSKTHVTTLAALLWYSKGNLLHVDSKDNPSSDANTAYSDVRRAIESVIAQIGSPEQIDIGEPERFV